MKSEAQATDLSLSRQAPKSCAHRALSRRTPAAGTLLRFDGARRLTPHDLELAAAPLRVALTERVRRDVHRCAEFVDEAAAAGTPIYGLTTGYGSLVGFAAHSDPVVHGKGLIRFLEVGQGDLLPPALGRAMLLHRVWVLAAGRSGVSLEVLDHLCDALATSWAPAVREFGSVGASGDLVPLAHAAAGLMGESEAFAKGRLLPGSQALNAVALAPLVLRGRDALGLVNGTSLTAAAAGLAVAEARRAVGIAISLGALLAELLGAETAFVDVDLLSVSGHPGSAEVAKRLSRRLSGAVASGLRPLQEPYSLRCMPQLLGAVVASVSHAETVIGHDLNGISDNPLFFPELGKVVHGGNFFGQPVAFAADALNLALVQLANLAERQLDLLLDPHRNTGLPLCLAARPGEQSGLTGLQIAATSIVAAMRRMASPASIQSLPTNVHNQDVVPFGTQAALEAYRQAQRLRSIHAALAIALRQAAYLGARPPRSLDGRELLDLLTSSIPPFDPDRPLYGELPSVADVLHHAGSITGVGTSS
jgi:histidine ammonia-lyase